MNTKEKGCGRPRKMFVDWLLKTEEDNISYDELKMLAQDRSRWCQCLSEDGNLPYGQNTTAAAVICYFILVNFSQPLLFLAVFLPMWYCHVVISIHWPFFLPLWVKDVALMQNLLAFLFLVDCLVVIRVSCYLLLLLLLFIIIIIIIIIINKTFLL